MYIDFFGFSEKPFNLTPDPRFLYLSANHREALAAMLYGIHERRGFIAIIGEVGTGKTTLLRALFNELDKNTETILILNTTVDFDQLMHNILWELDIPTGGKTKIELIQVFNQFLIHKLSSNTNVALIIDEAQNLPPETLEELRMLSNLETEREKLLQILLIGQPELLSKLSSPGLRQLKQRIAINCFLTPLSDEERLQYIAHRLSVAGCKDNNLFSKNALDLVCKHSAGIPRIINILCDNALLAAYGRDCRRIDTAIVKEVIDDFSRSSLPSPGENAVTTAAPDSRKRFLTKARAALVLFMLIALMLSGLGISAYGSRGYPLMSALFSGLSAQWDKLERSINLNTTPGTRQTPSVPELSAAQNVHQLAVPEVEEQAPDDAGSIAEEPSLPEQIPLTKENYYYTPPENHLSEKNATVVTARKGDMISTLVTRHYGTAHDTLFDIIKRANPRIEDLDRIDIGQQIVLPAPDIDNFIIEIAKNIFSVHIATFSSYAYAQSYLSRIKVPQHPLLFSPVTVAGATPWYRITMGGFATREEAQEVARSIISENYIMAHSLSTN